MIDLPPINIQSFISDNFFRFKRDKVNGKVMAEFIERMNEDKQEFRVDLREDYNLRTAQVDRFLNSLEKSDKYGDPFNPKSSFISC